MPRKQARRSVAIESVRRDDDRSCDLTSGVLLLPRVERQPQRRPRSVVSRQHSERVASTDRAHGAEVALVECRDVARFQPLSEND
jgi:hypothetical protein